MSKIERTIAPSDNTTDKVSQLIKRTDQKDIDFVNRLKDPNRKYHIQKFKSLEFSKLGKANAREENHTDN